MKIQEKYKSALTHFNPYQIEKVESVDLDSGDFGSGTLYNKDVIILKSGHEIVLLNPNPDINFKKNQQITLKVNDNKFYGSVWEVRGILKDITNLSSKLKKESIDLIFINAPQTNPIQESNKNEIIFDENIQRQGFTIEENTNSISFTFIKQKDGKYLVKQDKEARINDNKSVIKSGKAIKTLEQIMKLITEANKMLKQDNNLKLIIHKIK